MSWADTLKEYENEKRKGFTDSSWEPEKRVSRPERLLRERDLDPISMKYRDPVREEMLESANMDALNARVTKHSEISNKKYNIVTNVGPAKPVIKKEGSSTVKRDWNFLSHLPIEKHNSAPLLYEQSYNQASAYHPKSLQNLSHLAVNQKGREFNVISNKFHENHTNRMNDEEDNLKQKIIDKYWRTHNYDPIRTRYCNLDAEAKFIEQRQMLQTVHGLAQSTKLAPSTKNSEGYQYDIISNIPKDVERLQASLTIKDRSLHKTIGHKIEATMRDISISKEALQDSRRMNRLSYDRWSNQVERGYNPVNNMDYVYEPVMPRPAPSTAVLRPNFTPTNTFYHPENITDKVQIPFTPSSLSTFETLQQHQHRHSLQQQQQQQPQSSLFLSSDRRDVRTAAATSTVPSPSSPSRRRLHSPQVTRNESNMTTLLPQIQPQSQLSGKAIAATNALSVSGERTIVKSKLTARSVPSLNLSLAGGSSTVTYVEPQGGPPGMPVPIVRTGGWSD